MRFGVVDIIHWRHDDAFILDQINGVVFPYRRAGGDRSALLLPCGLQLLQHADNPRLLVRFQNIVKRLQFEGLNGMLFPGGNEHNKRLVGKLIDVLRQQDAVQRRNINIQKNGVDPVMLQKFQHVQPIVKGTHNLHLTVGFDEPGELLLSQNFIFNDNDFHITHPEVTVMPSHEQGSVHSGRKKRFQCRVQDGEYAAHRRRAA